MTHIRQFLNQIICGDALTVLKTIPDESVDCIVTSPPYWSLRDYGMKGQIGLEPTVNDYLEKLLAVFDEARRILKRQGTCWVNIGDTYFTNHGASHPFTNRPKQSNKYHLGGLNFMGGQRKSLCQIPSRFAIEMCKRGWILRNEIIWHKPNCMPSSVTDRFTVDYEKLFFFVKSQRYSFAQQFEPLAHSSKVRFKRRAFNPDTRKKYDDADLLVSTINHKTIEKSHRRVLERGRIKRCVWTIANKPFRGPHFAVFPPEIAEVPVKAGCPKDGIVLDPFIGSGTTAIVAQRLGRKFIGIELNPKYVQMAKQRLKKNSGEKF